MTKLRVRCRGSSFGHWGIRAIIRYSCFVIRHLSQGVLGEEEVGDGFAVEDVVLEDAFEDGGVGGVVPGVVGVDDGDGAAGADAEAVALGAEDVGGGAVEFKFGEAALEVVPGVFAALGVATVGACADEDMAADTAEVEGFGLVGGGGGWRGFGHGSSGCEEGR